MAQNCRPITKLGLTESIGMTRRSSIPLNLSVRQIGSRNEQSRRTYCDHRWNLRNIRRRCNPSRRRNRGSSAGGGSKHGSWARLGWRVVFISHNCSRCGVHGRHNQEARRLSDDLLDCRRHSRWNSCCRIHGVGPYWRSFSHYWCKESSTCSRDGFYRLRTKERRFVCQQKLNGGM